MCLNEIVEITCDVAVDQLEKHKLLEGGGPPQSFGKVQHGNVLLRMYRCLRTATQNKLLRLKK